MATNGNKCIFRLKTILKSTLVLVHLGSPQGWLRTKQQWCDQPCPHIQCVKWNLSNRRSSLSLGVSSSPSAAPCCKAATLLQKPAIPSLAASKIPSPAEVSETSVISFDSVTVCSIPKDLKEQGRWSLGHKLVDEVASATQIHRVLRLSRRSWPSLELQFCNKGTKKSYVLIVLHCRSTGCCIQVADIDPQGWIVVRCA